MSIEEEIMNMPESAILTDEQKNSKEFFLTCVKLGKFNYALGCSQFITRDFLNNNSKAIIDCSKNKFPYSLHDSRVFRDFLIENKEYDLLDNFSYELINEIKDDEIIKHFNERADIQIANKKLIDNYSKYKAMRMGRIDLFDEHTFFPHEYQFFDEFYDIIIANIDKFKALKYGDYYLALKSIRMGNFGLAEKLNFGTTIPEEEKSLILEKYWNEMLEYNENGVSKLFSNFKELFDYYLKNGRYDRVVQFRSVLLTKDIIDSHENEIMQSIGNNISDVSSYNSNLFMTCLKNGRYDLCAQFNIDWSIELIQEHGKEILKYMDHLPYALRNNTNLFNYVIEIGRYDLIEDFFDEIMTDEILNKYADVITQNMKSVSYAFRNNPIVLKSVIKNKRYDLIDQFYSQVFTDEVLSSKEFIDYIKEVNVNDLPYSLCNSEVLEKALSIKKYDFLDRLYGYLTEEMFDKYGIDFIKELNHMPFEFLNNKKVLQMVIQANRFDLISLFDSKLFVDDILDAYIDIVPKGSGINYHILENENSIRRILDKKRYDLLIFNGYDGSSYTKFPESIYRDYASVMMTEMTFLPPMDESNVLLHYAFDNKITDKIPLFSIRAYDDELISKYGKNMLSLLEEKFNNDDIMQHNMNFMLDLSGPSPLKLKELLILFLENDIIIDINKFDNTLFNKELIDKYFEKILNCLHRLNSNENDYLLKKVLDDNKFDYLVYFSGKAFTNIIIDKYFDSLVEYYSNKNQLDHNLSYNSYFLEKIIQANRDDLLIQFKYGAFTDEIIDKYYLYILEFIKKNGDEIPYAMQTGKLVSKFIENGLYDYAKKMSNLSLSKQEAKRLYGTLIDFIRKDFQSPLAKSLLTNINFIELYINDCSVEEVCYLDMDLLGNYSNHRGLDMSQFYPKLIQWIIKYNNNKLPNGFVSDVEFKKYCLNNGYNEFCINFTFLTGQGIIVDIDEIIKEYAPLLNIDFLELKRKIDFLLHSNDEILNTLIPLILTNRMNVLSTKHLLTIGLYPDLQQELIGLSDYELLIIDKIFDFTDGIEFDTCSVIYNVLKNFGYYRKLINESGNMNDEQLNNLIFILQRRDNIFGINSINDLSNINLSKKMLYKYNSFDINIASKKDIDNVREMLLLKKYGIDLTEAYFICHRYCMDKSIVLKSELDDNLKTLLADIYDIVYCESIDELKFLYTTSDLVLPDFKSMLFLESYIRGEYAKLYNKTLYHIKGNDLLQDNEQLITNLEALKKIKSISYNGEMPQIYLLHDDFNMQIHALGAYSGYRRPSDFLEDWNRPKMASHGICTSYIGNNQIANARAYHPILGFDEMEESDLLLSANYDIGSSGANVSYAISREIVTNFLPPEENINYTRHTHNEMVIERMKYINDMACKKMPSYVVYLVDDINNKYNYMTKEELVEEFRRSGHDEGLIDKIKNNSDTYFLEDMLEKKLISKEDARKISCVFYCEEIAQAAVDMHIPIVIVDRLLYAKKEKAKCEEYYKELIETRDVSYISLLLLTYFNNMIGCIDYGEYGLEYCTYFNDSGFDKLFNKLIDSINDIDDNDIKLRQLSTIEKELNKEDYKRKEFKGGAPRQLKPLTTYIDIIKKKINELNLLMEDKDHEKNK